MKTRPKDLGTRLETNIVRNAQDYGLIAERLPEGAANDRGDIRIYTDTEWVGEVKDRMNLNVPRALEKALAKSQTPDTFLAYRKMVRKTGNTNRTQDGPVVVVVTLDRFLELLHDSTTVYRGADHD
jgi:hypothetical protein